MKLGCFGTRDRGTCTNKLTISRHEVEERVLSALQDKLMRKDFFEEFCREFAREMNRLRMEQRAGLSGAKRELERVKREIQKVVEAIVDGVHPSMADLCRSKVEALAAALQRKDTRLEASEMLRGLIEAIVLTREKGQLRIEVRGNLAAMLTAAQQTKRSPETGDLLVPVQLVAKACSQRYLQLWSGAA